jgi:hypothetical protein
MSFFVDGIASFSSFNKISPLKLIHVYKAYYRGVSAYYSGYCIGIVPWGPFNGR